ncbi:MAG: RnfABCDGE type electron transport complex subunit G [Lachnospiraceae bacterium]|nr:RnfABCDGE type electron transport complex subunit G [Lachnospiraceae bacterium]MDE6253894.1 RnfABCDGE type electron transport complex subunit G [Lachnospiraceae bacterium]
MKNIIKNTIILFVITLIAGVLLGAVYEITKDARAEQERKTTEKAYKTVFKNAETFDTAEYDKDGLSNYLKENGYSESTAYINDVVEAKSNSGEILGYVITATDKNGYGGDITFTLGITSDGVINGIAFLTLDETAGMGMKAKDNAFKSQFEGLEASSYDTAMDSYQNNGIDAISGATITTKAVANGVNAGVLCFKYLTGGAE